MDAARPPNGDDPEIRAALLQVLEACELIVLALQQTTETIEPLLTACERGDPSRASWSRRRRLVAQTSRPTGAR